MARIFLAVAVLLVTILVNVRDVGAQYPTISVSPQQGRIGESFSVTGKGFQSFASVEVRFAGKWRIALADYYGEFKTSFVVPPVDPGVAHEVRVASGNLTIFSAFQVLQPEIAMSQNLLMTGDRITIWIYGAMPFDMARVYLNNNDITQSPAIVSSGGTAKLEIMVPSLAPGYYNLRVKGARFEASRVVNFVPDSPYRVETVLSPIKDKVIRIWSYYGEMWLLYDSSIPPELNTLREFIPGSGYFVKMKDDAEFAAVGGRAYKLYKEWNLIGW